MKRLKISQFCRTLLILCLMVGMAAPLQAATGYEVTDVTFSNPVTSGQFVRVTEDLKVSWTAPTGTDPILNYFLKFNTSSTPLTGTELDDTTHDFMTTDGELISIIPNSTFDAYNSDELRYLHIRTLYVDTVLGLAYSDDVVSEEIRIDNVAPTGTLTLDPTSGSTKEINVSMSPSEAIKYYWLNDASTIPGVPGTDYSDYPQATVSLRDGISYGDVTISGWFEDFAGNCSTAASASAVYDYTAPVAIQYNAPSMNVGGTLGFTVDSLTLYNWTITPSISGVAEFAGGGITQDDQDSVIVEGKAVGTFTVSAVPSLGGAQLTTDTISVTSGALTVNIPLVAGWNLIAIPNQPADTSVASVLTTIDGKYTSVWTYNTAADTWYKYYTPATGLDFLNDLTGILPGKGYWVEVGQNATLTVVEPVATPSTVSLSVGWNLIGLKKETGAAITTVMASVDGNYTSIWNYNTTLDDWYKYYTPATGLDFLNDMTTIEFGKGYWIEVSTAGNWTP